MAGSVYVQFHTGDLPALNEGEVIPLLYVATDDDWRYAFAVVKAAESGRPDETRRNLLLASLLRAAGFEWDPVSGPNENPETNDYDFWRIPSGGLDPDTVFTSDSKPSLPAATDVQITTIPPDGDVLQVLAAAIREYDLPSGVLPFGWEAGPSWWRVAPDSADDTPADPILHVELRLQDRLVGRLGLAAVGDAATFRVTQTNEVVRVNGERCLPNNQAIITADDRHHRRTVDNGAVSYRLPPPAPAAAELELQLFAAVRVRPDPSLPVEVTFAGDALAAHFTAGAVGLQFRPSRPCLRVTVAGPLIQADPEGGGDWLSVIEQGQKRIGDKVEQVNDYLRYTFEACLPEPEDWTLPLIGAVEAPLLTFPGGRVPSAADLWNHSVNGVFPNLRDLRAAFEAEFDVSFPDIGGLPEFSGFRYKYGTLKRSNIPGFEQFWQFDFEKIHNNIPNLVLPALPGVALPDLTGLKLRVRASVELPSIDAIDGFRITFATTPDVRIGDLLEAWDLRPSPAVRLPDLRVQEIDGLEIRVDRLVVPPIALRVIRPDAPTLFRLRHVDLDTFTFVVDYEGDDLRLPDVSAIDIFQDLDFPLTKAFLVDLLGDVPAVDFRLAIPDVHFQNLNISLDQLLQPTIPFELAIRFPKPGVTPPEFPTLRLWLGVKFDLVTMRLVENRVYFYFPRLDTPNVAAAPAATVRQQAVDLDILTLSVPLRQAVVKTPDEDEHDGYLDFSARELVIDLVTANPPDPPPRLTAYFPGGVSERAVRLGPEGVDALDNGDADRGRLRAELARRFHLEFKEVEPEGPAGRKLFLRLNGQGITLAAELQKKEVEVDTAGTEDEDSPAGLIKPFKFTPQEKRGEFRSRLVVVNNAILEATVLATTEVPGVRGLIAQIAVSLKQSEKGKLPDVVAAMELARDNEAPIAELSIGLLELALKKLDLGLTWHRSARDWDYRVVADGSIGFTAAAAVIPDLEGLKAPSIHVVGLDLRRMNLKQVRVPLRLERPVRFEMLNKLVAVELGDLNLAWVWEGGLPRPRLLACQLARFEFRRPGALEVHVKVGGLDIAFDADLTARIRLPSRLGLEASLGPAARFAGDVGWVDTPDERYFFAAGSVRLEGFPEVAGLLKFGTGVKFNGRRAANVVLYGAADTDYPLTVPGAVVKKLGAGIGVNNRLAAVPPLPSAEAILERIDTVNPGDIDGWSFVREDGTYVSVVGRAVLASNQGPPTALSAYVADLVFSIDTNFDLVAAGRLWVSASVARAEENRTRPALAGAMVLSPRQNKLEVVAESRPNPFVEGNQLLEKLLARTRVRFAFRLAPGLVDYHLEEVAYQDTMFGVELLYQGSYRFAVFRDTVLLRSELAASGRLVKSLQAGPGGFDLEGGVRLGVGYGGLLGAGGARAYAFLDASATFRVAAWIEIGFEKSFKICRKRFTIRWTVKFSARSPSLELTFRGNIGLNERGQVGFDALVGINLVICGYRLNASGRLAAAAEVYDEVRASVAAFEHDLEATLRARVARTAAIPTRQPKVDVRTLSRPRGTATGTEEWKLYSSSRSDAAAYFLLLPGPRERWLAPRFARVERLDAGGADGAVRLTVTCTGHGLSMAPGTVRTIGLTGVRGSDPANAAAVNALNDVPWVLTECPTADTFVLDGPATLPDPASLTFGTDYFGGTWYVRHPELSEDAPQDVPQLLDDVERVVVPFGQPLLINDVAEDGDEWVVTTDAPHGLCENQRVVFTDEGGVIDFGGGLPVNAQRDAARDVTLRVTVSDTYTFRVGRVAPSPAVAALVTDPGFSDWTDDATPTWWEVVEGAVVRSADTADGTGSCCSVTGTGSPIRLRQRVVLAAGRVYGFGFAVRRTADPAGAGAVALCLCAADGTVLVRGAALTVASMEGTWQAVTGRTVASPEAADEGYLEVRFDGGSGDACLIDDVSVTARPMPVAGGTAARAVEVASFWNAATRSARVAGPDEDAVRLYQSLAADALMLVEGAAPSDQEDEYVRPDYTAYVPVFHPGYESAERHWMPLEDQFLLPDGVLSSRFRPLEELGDELDGAEVRAAREYLDARDRLRRQEVHRGFDLDPADEAHRVRGQLGQLFAEDLGREPRPARFGRMPPGAPADPDDPDFRIGWLFDRPADVTDDTYPRGVAYVRRTGGTARPVQVTQPEADPPVQDPIRPLPVRQDFVVDRAAPGGAEVARVVVKLPVRLDDRLLTDLERLGRLQIYRQFPWQDFPVLVRDFVQPDVGFLEAGPDDVNPLGPPVDGTGVATKVTLRAAEVPHPRAQLRGLFVRLTDKVDADDVLVTTRVAEVTELAEGVIELTLEDPRKAGRPECKVQFFAAGTIVPGPYVLSDEFALADRAFTDPDLVANGFEAGRTRVTYSLRCVPAGHTGDRAEEPANIRAELRDWLPVELHVPRPDPFPRRLAVVVTPDGLLAADSSEQQDPAGQQIEVQFVDVGGESPAVARLGPPGLKAEDLIELWAAEHPLRQTGFYAGDTDEPGEGPPADTSTVGLKDVPREGRYESTAGKFRLTLRTVAGRVEIADAAGGLRPGFGYRLYVRPTARAGFALLAPLDHLIVREFPAAWDGTVRFRTAEQIERIPAAAVAAVEAEAAELLPPEDLSADDLFVDGGNAVRTTWRSQSLLDGGAEVVYRDADDPNMTARQLCEVVEEDVFQERRTDFARAAHWDLTPRKRRERVAVTRADAPRPSGDEVWEYFLLPEGRDEDGARNQLRNAAKEFEAALKQVAPDDPDDDGVAWTRLLESQETGWATATYFVSQLARFRKSPLNLRIPIEELRADLIVRLVRHLFTGLRPPESDDLAAAGEALRRAEAELQAALAAVEQAPRNDAPTTPGGEAAFLDRDLARRLTAILRRRLAIADEVVSLRVDEEESPAQRVMAAVRAGTEKFPRQSEWERHAGEARALLDGTPPALALPTAADLAARVNVGIETAADGFRTAFKQVADALIDQLDLYLPEADSPADIANRDRFARIARRAAGLTAFLNRLCPDVAPAEGRTGLVRRVFKRPHHEVVTATGPDGVTPQPTPLGQYLPDDALAHAPDQLPPVPRPRLDDLPLPVARLAVLSAAGAEVWTADGADPAETPPRLLQHWPDVAGHRRVRLLADGGRHLLLASGGGGVVPWAGGVAADRAGAAVTQPAVAWDVLTGQRVAVFERTHDAVFARTQNGLEVLTAGVEGGVQAWATDPVQRLRTFTHADNPFHALAIAYDPRGRFVVAVCDDNRVRVWRDLGKGDQELAADAPVVDITDIVTEAFDALHAHLLTVRVAEGTRVVVGVGKAVFVLDPDRLPAEGEALGTVELAENVTSLAFDGIGLRVAAGTEGGMTHVWNWDALVARQDPEGGPPTTGPAQVEFFHSAGETFLAVGGEAGVDLWHWQPGKDPADPRKVTKTPSVAVAAALMPAITSSTSRAVLALAQVWERMGFAVDFAAVDERNQLLTRSELLDAVGKVRKTWIGDNPDTVVSVNGIPHRVFVVSAQEPDGDYRRFDKVGFSFVKVAVVPTRFLALCAAAGPHLVARPKASPDDQAPTTLPFDQEVDLSVVAADDFLAVLGGPAAGSVRRVVRTEGQAIIVTKSWPTDGQPDRDSVVAVVRLAARSATDELQTLFAFRNVTLPADLSPPDPDVLPSGSDLPPEQQADFARSLTWLLHLREAARYAGQADDWEVEPRAERWLTVPAAGGWSHAAWAVPDRHGHRFRVAVRRVSRYEPLVRWWKQIHRLVPVPVTETLTGDGVNDHVAVAETDGRTYLRLSTDLGPPPAPTQQLRVEIVAGSGRGQRRDVLGYDPDTKRLDIDPGDPWLDPISDDADSDDVDGLSYCRVTAESRSWVRIGLPPALDPDLGEGPRPLTVYQYPRARTVQFSFQLPPEGQRSLYNQLSKVRTGYRAVDHAYRYQLLDRGPDDPLRLDAALALLRLVAEARPARPFRFTEVRAGDAPPPRLFRHERLVTLPHLPFFYRYRLDVRSLFAARPRERDRLTDAELLPADPNLSPLAERPPTRLRVTCPDLRRTSDPVADGTCGDGSNRSVVVLNGLDDADAVEISRRIGQGEPVWLEVGQAEVRPVIEPLTDRDDGRKQAVVSPKFKGDPSGRPYAVFFALEYDATVYPSACGDHLTRAEREHEPTPIRVEFRPLGSAEALRLPAGRLPDLALDYGLFWRVVLDTPDGEDTSELYAPAAWVRMPWSGEYRPPDGAPNGWAVVESARGVSVLLSDRWGVHLRGANGVSAPFFIRAYLQAASDPSVPLPDGLSVRVNAGADGLAWTDGDETGTLAAGEEREFAMLDDANPTLQRAAESAAPDQLELRRGAAAEWLPVPALAVPIVLLRESADTPAEDVGYRVAFRLRADQAGSCYQSDRFYLQAVRAGVPAKPLQLGPPS